MGWVVLLALCSLAGCKGPLPRQAFMNVHHRRNYDILDWEILKLQFFISTEVLAKNEATGKVVLLPTNTPGLPTQVGNDWIRVAFEPGGPGVPFLTDASQADDMYWFATRTEQQGQLVKVKDTQQRAFTHEGSTYTVVRGANAYLLVQYPKIQALIKKRRHLKGRLQPEKKKRQ